MLIAQTKFYLKFSIDLAVLSKVEYQTPFFSPLTDFLISTPIIYDDPASLFFGTFQHKPVLIETLTRIPFRIACREILLLDQLQSVKNVVKIIGKTRNAAIGVVTFAYHHIDIAPLETLLSLDESISCFKCLLSTLAEIHQKNIVHGCICGRSVMICSDRVSIVLSFFHSSSFVGEPRPLSFQHKCSPPNVTTNQFSDDIYSAAMWFKGVARDDGGRKIPLKNYPEPLKKLIDQMLSEVPSQRPPATQCLSLLGQIHQ